MLKCASLGLDCRAKLTILTVGAKLRRHPDPTRSSFQAEREASKIVQKAREFRTKRVREARDEAKKEIEAYRAKKEAEYKAFEAEHTQGNKQAEDEANREAEAQIQQIKESAKKGQDKVIDDLLSAVFEVKSVPAS
ncbi:V-type proton ATPase subunit G [Madurella mycetomatis]|uniref:V-type proton ATPase subunit G n=1 Tax=Madurella mycetomatis TaxID=100816 RepID=A0A175WCQ5_9PEZI|nr:V-type proton ATPase subunit G [Madurella mycetomatis]